MLDPDHTYVDASVTLAADVTLCPGAHSRVGPFAVLEPRSDIPGATVTGPFYTAGPDAP
jgi:hypothetical protein